MSGRSPAAWAIIASSFLVCLVVALAAHSRMTLNPEFRVFVQMIKLNKEINAREKTLAEEGMRICEKGATTARAETSQFARRLVMTYEHFNDSLGALKPGTPGLKDRRQLLVHYITLKKEAGVLLARAIEKDDYAFIDQAKQKIAEAKKVAAELSKPAVWYGVRPTHLTR